MYSTLTHFDIYTPIPKKVVSGWGDGWASLLAPGEPFEQTTLRSPSGQFVFRIESSGHLLFEDRELKKNTTLFSQTSDGEHGLGVGVHVPDGATWHAVLTRRGVFVVYYVTPKQPEVSTFRAIRSSPTQIDVKRDDEDLGDLFPDANEADDNDDRDKNNGLGFLSMTAWDSNRLPNCHKLPKYTAANSSPFLNLDDTGLLQISTSNEVNCVLKHPEQERLQKP